MLKIRDAAFNCDANEQKRLMHLRYLEKRQKEKKANEEACTEASECQSNYCNDEGKCADAPATDENGDKKDNDADCGICGYSLKLSNSSLFKKFFPKVSF